MAGTAQNHDFERLVRESFEKQQAMRTLGARLTRVVPGEVDIELPFSDALTQQHGFLHAGVVTAVLDSTCGYAAFSLMPPGAGVLSIEFKVNLLAPAKGEVLIARGRVVRPGRTISVCQADGTMRSGSRETPIATMLATIMTVMDRPDVVR
ncbi:MAG TPA: PaaI family thioesterase [Candidatus Eisenbacteria bacterium]|nr:PaaI family thioesterase [Candidatus Eisenbacteria bacterium]